MYEDFYNLRAKPFRLSPDHRFFYASRGHKRALAYLRYGLTQDEGFIVITGAPGTGKTTLAQILLNEMDQSHVVVAHLTTTQLDADELLRMVTAAFGLPYEDKDKPGLLRTLEDFLLLQSRNRKRVLLVVDEAQNLPPRSIEELRMLSNLQVGDKALLQTFLLGQTQFHQMLERPDLEQFQQRVIANYHLSELAEDECQRYIETRLQHVGWQGDPHYTAAAYQEIYQYTSGVPRRINMLCDRLMLFSFLEETHEIDEAMLQEVTDELKREISGKPFGTSDESYEHDSLYADHDQPTEQINIKKASEADKKTSKATSTKKKKAVKKKLGKKSTGKKSAAANNKVSGAGVVKELEAEDKNSAYSMNQSESGDVPLDLDVSDSSLDKVIPEESYEELVAQEQVGGIDSEKNGSKDTNQVRASKSNAQQNNKDRFHVIAGGRNDRRVNKGEGVTARPDYNPSSEEPAPVSGDSDVVLRKILRLVLAYHRSPRSFPGLDDPSQPLPAGITKILSLVVSDDDALKNLRLITVMGISPAMLRAAVRFFVRRVLFIPGGDDYRVLGLSSDSTEEQVEEHYDLLMRIMRQEKQSHEDSSVTRIKESYVRLCNGEVSQVANDPSAGIADEIEEFDDGLDIDLSPTPNKRGFRLAGAKAGRAVEQLSDIITGDMRTAQTSRNLILASGAIVIVFVLFLTQITGTDEPDVDRNSASLADIQQVLEPEQQNAEILATEVPSDQIASTSGVSDEVADTEVKNAPDENAGADARRQRILAELRAHTEAKEKASREAEAIERARLEAEARQSASEAKARQEKVAARARAEAKARQDTQVRARAEATAMEAKQAQAEAEAAATLKARQEADQARANAEVNIRINAMNLFVTRLENAYASGNLEAFLSLFAINARTNDQTDLEGIRVEYKDFFSSTSLRKISLKNMDWELGDNLTRGVGGYEVTVRNNGSSSDTLLTGSITLHLKQSRTGRMQITRFNFSDAQPRKKVVEKPVVLTSTPGTSASTAGALATINELNQVLENFARTYGAGDINQFMTLFGADAKTNDRSTLQGIREDYTGLFGGTEFRKIDISAMQWQREGGVSNGDGAYVVKVQPKGKGSIDVYRGKLRFTIGRYGDKLLISYFAFK